MGRRTIRTPVVDRLLPRVNFDGPGGCWLWTGADNGVGYGVIGSGRRSVYTHRVMYEHMVGPIPDGLHIDHLCRVTICCNPAHLEPVTPAENIRRGNARLTSGNWRAAYELAKTQCPEGHPYDLDNTYLTPKGHRQCRICKRAAKERYTLRTRELINAKARAARGYTGPVTACRRSGHLYTPENTYVNPRNGRRFCIACRNQRRQAA